VESRHDSEGVGMKKKNQVYAARKTFSVEALLYRLGAERTHLQHCEKGPDCSPKGGLVEGGGRTSGLGDMVLF